MPVVTLLLVLLVVGVLIFIITAALLGDALLKPPRMNDGKSLYLYHRLSPADLQLEFAEVDFKVRDRSGQIKIAGWWIPPAIESNRCVLLVHGYADGKIGAIAWAPLWHSLGFNVCAIDLRAHGASEGRYCTAGILEGPDVAAVVRILRETYPAATQKSFLFGISMGAIVSLRAAMESEDIAGVILESPYADFVDTARRTAAGRAMPSGSCFTLAVSIAQQLKRIDYQLVRTSRLLPLVHFPVLWIHGDADRLVAPDARTEIQDAMAERNNLQDRLLCVAAADHLMTLNVAPKQVTAAISEFTSHAAASESAVIHD